MLLCHALRLGLQLLRLPTAFPNPSLVPPQVSHLQLLLHLLSSRSQLLILSSSKLQSFPSKLVAQRLSPSLSLGPSLHLLLLHPSPVAPRSSKSFLIGSQCS